VRAARALDLLDAEVRVARGDAAGAVALLDRDGAPPRPVLLQRAQAALAAHRAGAPPATLRASVEALQTWVAERRDDAAAWSLLAQGAALLGQPLRAVRAEAEVQAALGDLPGAIDRLRAGQRLAREGGTPDFIELSVIDARLRELQAELRTRQSEQQRGG
jgi:predicted Zn-dependent protease